MFHNSIKLASVVYRKHFAAYIVTRAYTLVAVKHINIFPLKFISLTFSNVSKIPVAEQKFLLPHKCSTIKLSLQVPLIHLHLSVYIWNYFVLTCTLRGLIWTGIQTFEKIFTSIYHQFPLHFGEKICTYQGLIAKI